ncbi:hypothetical protein DM02DRAFT_697748 [Periconia macrospinosa]|uniref:Uncharacterized protein n=1 Tax=Periconia macrospinosa TaxID=97972 RepID=A0A2V1D4S7_9PLEO|nr:hypothetical protein DM02DRAFT_697748 [Periconia macrospinosa]
MSGLEPVAALSFACNILQIIGVGIETVRVARQVYQDGALDSVLTDNATLLRNLSDRVRSVNVVNPGTKLKAQDKQLLELAEKCRDASRDLQEEVNFLNGQPTKAKLVATLKTAAKTTWRKRRLDRLDQRLKDTERLLQTGLLSRIYERCVAIDDSLSSLDITLRDFIKDYRKEKHNATDLIKKHVSTESKRSESAVKSHVTQVVSQTENSIKQYIATAHKSAIEQENTEKIMAMRERLLNSLKFDRMNERKNQIASSHPDTCTWLLQDGSDVDSNLSTNTQVESQDTYSEVDDAQSTTKSHDYSALPIDICPWDSFSDWLRSTETVYWISGKPGSGKTTVVKYLLSQSQTQDYLSLWKADPIVISHFFWRPGTTMQQSIKGLFCSLLHQLLSESLEVVKELFPNPSSVLEKDSEFDWSEEELWSFLESIVRHLNRPIAIFLDGLDEVLPQDGVLRLLGFIDKLQDQAKDGGKIKLCLASRPEPLFLKQLGNYPNLRLEDLNTRDLREYAKEKIVVPDEYDGIVTTDDALLLSIPMFGEEKLSRRDEIKGWLVKSLVDKAEGVFLWLCLTANTVMKGLTQGETLEDLSLRIKNLPGDLANLYADMWERINDDGYHLKARAASYLQLALASVSRGSQHPLNLFIMMVAITPTIAERLLNPDSYDLDSSESLVEACQRTFKDSIARCAGLLVCRNPRDVHEIPEGYYVSRYGREYEKLLPYISYTSQYSWLHRTAQDFLLETEAGNRILSCGRFTGRLAFLKLKEGLLAVHRLFRAPESSIGSTLMDIWSYKYSDALTESEKIEISRLLLLCEQLYNHGFLMSQLSMPSESMQFYQEYEHPSYELSVRRQHDFLVEMAHLSEYFDEMLISLLPLARRRGLDATTLSQIFLYACKFKANRNKSGEALEERVKSMNTLLDLGASANLSEHYRVTLLAKGEQPFVVESGTPMKVLTTSLFRSAIALHQKDNGNYRGYFQRLFELLSRLVSLGASLDEEVYVTFALDDNSIVIAGIWQADREIFKTGYESETDGIVLIIAYPASTILSMIHSNWIPSADLDGLREVFNSGYGKGHLIAIISYRGAQRIEPPQPEITEAALSNPTPSIFHSRTIYNVAPDDDSEGKFVHVTQLLEDRVYQAIEKQDYSMRSPREGIHCNVTVPKEIRATLVQAIEQSTWEGEQEQEYIKEDRRVLRTTLGVQTPLEEPEWQGPLSMFIFPYPRHWAMFYESDFESAST